MNEPYPLKSHDADGIHVDYMLTRADFKQLLTASLELRPGLSVTLHPHARMVATAMADTEVIDPRGVLDDRLNRLRVATWNYISERNPETFAALSEAYGLTFAST